MMIQIWQLSCSYRTCKLGPGNTYVIAWCRISTFGKAVADSIVQSDEGTYVVPEREVREEEGTWTK